MTRYVLAVVALFAVAFPVAAQPVITSIAPSSGPDSGGTWVTVRGRGFSTCIVCSPPAPPPVYFGGIASPNAHFINGETMQAMTPPHLPGTVDVTVEQTANLASKENAGVSTLPQAFTFVTTAGGAYETILLPSYMPTVRGAFGSEFRTIVRVANKGERPLPVYGVDMSCWILDPPQIGTGEAPFYVNPFQQTQIITECSEWPARLFYVPRERAGEFSANVRVTDVSRLALSHGTEIPVVRSAAVRNEKIVLLGVPLDARFRNTLRIYSPWQTAIPVTVTINGRSRQVTLQPGRNAFEPAYAAFTDFPRAGDLPSNAEQVYTVVIEPPPAAPVVVHPYDGAPIWAFISVTNNETQQITIITPD